MEHSKVEKIIGYKFKDKLILEEAMTHPSSAKFNKTRPFNYERMEFLGDGVLGLVIAELLYNMYKSEQEGSLTKRQSALVQGKTVSKIAFSLGLDKHIIMADGEEAIGGRKNANTMENLLEALIGAIYLDGGFEVAKKFIIKHWKPVAKEIKAPPKDEKTLLQEWAQGKGLAIPEYVIVEKSGPAHLPAFTVEVSVKGFPKQSATDSSKKAAEKKAAGILYNLIMSKS